jgi:DNA polymerase (family 10)
MENAVIADVFDEMADLLEFRGENPFRIRAYRTGARAVRDLNEPVANWIDDPTKNLADLPGIGKTLAEKCEELVRHGKLQALENLRQSVPEIVVQMARIPGLGAKKASRLQAELQISTLDELKAACEDGRVAGLKGFGKKSASSILDGIAIATVANERLKWIEGEAWVHAITRHMQTCPYIERMEFAGSFRRGRDTIGDLDLIVVARDHQKTMDHFEAFPGRSQTIGRGDTKASIRVGKGFQVDMRVVAPESFGAALQYFTGSQAHNIHVRRIAKDLGLKINEYGVTRVSDEVRVAGETEADVYAAIGLPWIPPELREDRQEFQWATTNQLPPLVTLDQIRGDLHMHTTASDGTASIREMADAAIACGLKYIAITDHSRRVSMANGLDTARLEEQWKTIERLQSEYDGRLRIFKGIECDILEPGGMDLPDDCLAGADWVLASIHYGQQQPRAQITERILGAIENRFVTCIAHPTGRLIHRRDPYEVDIDAVMHAAAANGTFLELNANPARLDLHDIHLAAARRLGITVAINSDAHSVTGLSVMRYGILQARRGGLTATDVLNTRSLTEIQTRLFAKRDR